MKVIKLTESDLIKIVKQVISEQIVKGEGDDPWEYKKDGVNFYARKKGSSTWIMTSGKSKESIQQKIFNEVPKKTTKKIEAPKQTDKTKNVSPNKTIIKFDPNFNPTIAQRSDTFQQYSRDTLMRKYDDFFASFKEATKLVGQISQRTFDQLNELRRNKSLDGKNFIIVNKDSAIACLFDGNYKFITKSSISTGKTKDKGEIPLTHEQWANLSIECCKNKDNKIKSWLNTNKDLLKPDGKLDWEKYEKYLKRKKTDKAISEFPYSFEYLADKKLNITRPGLYKIGSGYKSHYAGAPDIVNTYPMVDAATGQLYVQALHVYSDVNRGKALSKASSQNVELNKDFTRMGSGCVNVDKNFILKIQEYDPKFIVILPDSGGKIDLKVIPMKTWSQKIVDLGDKCVRSFSNLF